MTTIQVLVLEGEEEEDGPADVEAPDEEVCAEEATDVGEEEAPEGADEACDVAGADEAFSDVDDGTEVLGAPEEGGSEVAWADEETTRDDEVRDEEEPEVTDPETGPLVDAIGPDDDPGST